MSRPSRIQIARADIIKTFDDSPRHVFWPDEIGKILEDNRDFWRLSQRTTVGEFIQFLVTSFLHEVEMNPVNHPQSRTIRRYVWRTASPFEIALALRRNSYLCQGTAVAIHGLNDQIPGRIYVNKEQSPKDRGGDLTQSGINRAFSGKQRESNYVYSFNQSEVVLLSGKHTSNLGTTEIEFDKARLTVTGIERTLIDIAVRPGYAGGPNQVLAAYRNARERISVGTLIATLRKLDYVYPFHQVIGFYMQKAGFPRSQYDRLKSMGLNFDFFAAYGMKDPDYVSEWRLFVPKGLN